MYQDNINKPVIHVLSLQIFNTLGIGNMKPHFSNISSKKMLLLEVLAGLEESSLSIIMLTIVITIRIILELAI